MGSQRGVPGAEGKIVSNHLNNVRAWYAEVLEDLYPKRSAGIAALMISLPLLERYIRQKTDSVQTSSSIIRA
jgi:hypothetical protein